MPEARPSITSMALFSASATCCSHCECPRDFDYTHAGDDARMCMNPICSTNMDEVSATADPGREGPLNPEWWPPHSSSNSKTHSLGWYATTTASTDRTQPASKERRVIFTGNTNAASAASAASAAAAAAPAAPAAAAAPLAATLLPGKEQGAKLGKKTSRHVGPRHSTKKATSRNRVNNASKTAAAASQPKQATEPAPGGRAVHWADAVLAAPPPPPPAQMARVAKTTPTALPPWEPWGVSSRAPAEMLPHQRDMHWPVGQFTVREKRGDVGKTSDLGPKGMLCAQAGAFTKIVQRGQMLPPTLAVQGMPSYSVDAYNDVLARMLVVYKRTGE